ncbi:MAG TPA: cytochrome b/b6 domain-containing protein [Candidatus Binataceae bacterium]|nr:cytochrome b/b6 domain-containing protein [Candidatus Binataceae bacterium]
MSAGLKLDVVEIEGGGAGVERAAYEHPLVIRWCHWILGVCILVLIFSGWQIFWAFPSFGPKLPQRDFIHLPRALMLGRWLGGGLQWHFTFIWIFVITGAVYLIYQIASGHYRMLLFTPADVSGVWPMVRHYFFFGPSPRQTQPYNPLQKLAYTTAVVLGILSVLTGMAVYNPVQFSLLAALMGGFRWARVWHFVVMAAFLAFIAGHLIMVALHGWKNFVSMLTGWKRDPEYR